MRRAWPDSAQWRTSSAAERVLPAARPPSSSQVRQSQSGGRWAGRARGWSVHSPGGRPQGQAWPYPSQGERSAGGSSLGRARRSSRRSRASVTFTGGLQGGDSGDEVLIVGDLAELLQDGAAGGQADGLGLGGGGQPRQLAGGGGGVAGELAGG